MRSKSKIAMTGILLVALILTCIPSSAYGALYESGSELFSSYKGMTEDEIYNLKKNDSADDLIKEIIGLEKDLNSSEDTFATLPYLMALIDKKDEFTSDQLIELIKDKDTDVGLDTAFVRMYVDKGADSSKLYSLLDDESIELEVKEYIVALGEFTGEELCTIFLNNDDSVSIIAMKRLTVLDQETAYGIAFQLLRDASHQLSSEQYISACLGLAEHFENYEPVSDSDRKEFMEEKLEAVSILWSLYYSSSDELVQSHTIYAMGRMHDFEVFQSIIHSDAVDFYLKVTVIEENVPLMIDLITKATSMQDIQTVMLAMQYHPILEVGEALSAAVKNGHLPKDNELLKLIEYIKAEGIKGVKQIEE